MFADSRDSGLVRGIGPWGLAAGVVNGVVGAGIFSLPAAMSQAAGSLAPLAYVVCALAMAAVVTCFAEAGSRLPTSGGPYGYVAAAFGLLPGFIAGMLIWQSSVLACGGIAAGMADALVSPADFHGLARAGIILAVIGGIAAVNLRGVRGASRLVAGATAIKLITVVILCRRRRLCHSARLRDARHACHPRRFRPRDHTGAVRLLRHGDGAWRQRRGGRIRHAPCRARSVAPCCSCWCSI